MSKISSYIEYNLPQDAYVAFDALTLKDFINKRLTDEGTFSDQIYEGSNLASVVEIIAYSYHVLMFYLNTTASESTFSQASIYENMNKIVNLVGYKPTGRQTSICTVDATASSGLAVGSYLLRRFSFFNVNDIQYTSLADYSFSKTTTDTEDITSLNNNVILYQGSLQQYPVYTASGEEFETLPVVITNTVDTTTDSFISSGSITVYVKEAASQKYYEYTEASNLYLNTGFDRVFDLRLNENGNYEVKFGNGVFGKQLSSGDEVVVYYIESSNIAGIISKNALNGKRLFTYTTSLFETIYNDVKNINAASAISITNSQYLTFNNPNNSTLVGSSESVDDIRKNTASFVAANLRLITAKDYKSFLSKNLNKQVQSIYIASNNEFLNEYINYFYKISVDPHRINRILLNQVNFADSCDFNNVNVFCVPSFRTTIDNQLPEYVPTALKGRIVDLTQDSKSIGVEVVPRDPIYIAFKIGISNKTILTNALADTCRLIIVRETNNKILAETLKSRVSKVILDFFDPVNNELGQILGISSLISKIISITGIKSIRTENTMENITFEGISFVAWNPLYPAEDISIINQDTSLSFFKYPFLIYPQTLNNYIQVIDE